MLKGNITMYTIYTGEGETEILAKAELKSVGLSGMLQVEDKRRKRK
jgi:hypothetical protein